MNAVGITDAPSATRAAQPSASRDGSSIVTHNNDAAVCASPTSAAVGAEAVTHPVACVLLPTWDRDRLELRLGTRVLRQFKIPSPHEEMILAALEEMNWPARIDDPSPSHDNPLHLEQAIESLNRRQRPPLVRLPLNRFRCYMLRDEKAHGSSFGAVTAGFAEDGGFRDAAGAGGTALPGAAEIGRRLHRRRNH